jgi:hypothetical protein
MEGTHILSSNATLENARNLTPLHCENDGESQLSKDQKQQKRRQPHVPIAKSPHPQCEEKLDNGSNHRPYEKLEDERPNWFSKECNHVHEICYRVVVHTMANESLVHCL